MLKYVVNPATGTAMEYCPLIQQPKQKEEYKHSFSNELGRLAKASKDASKAPAQ
jgi:hypothetical protein